MKKLLVTGGCGFIGSNFVKLALKRHYVTNIDSLSYAGNLENLKSIENNPHYRFIKADIRDDLVKSVDFNDIDVIINFAAQTHVDRSILSSEEFISTNISGTANLLDIARKYEKRFVQISTDEVYGDLERESTAFTEISPLRPRNPYAASKAAADMMVLSYMNTYSTDCAITRCSNNYGPYQFPEKFIPVVIYKAMRDEEIPLYGDGRNIRDWIFVNDHCSAVLDVALSSENDIFNIGSGNEMENRELAETILDILGKPHSLIKYVSDRPGHDRRYAINYDKYADRFGMPDYRSFRENLEYTVKWYLEHMEWVDSCIDGSYKEYFDKNYRQKGL